MTWTRTGDSAATLLEVGARVRATDTSKPESLRGRVGEVVEVDDRDTPMPYRVLFRDEGFYPGRTTCWYTPDELEVVSDPASASVNAPAAEAGTTGDDEQDGAA